jgi:N-acetylglutamate synthase-like GNAT family acetyltransferase
MNTDIKISEATIDDINELVQLVNSAYRGDSSKRGWTTEADLLKGIRITEEELLQQFNKPGHYLLKAINEAGEMIGCVSLLEKKEWMYLGMLTVRPDLQTAGIGKNLISACENFTIQKRKNGIEMTVISLRSELIAYYERRGFKQTGEKRPFPSDPKFGIQKIPLEFVVLIKQVL